MVIRVDEKNKIKFDEQEKQYIYYRILTKSELAAHLAEAQKQMNTVQTVIDTFQGYLDDTRVVESKEETLGK